MWRSIFLHEFVDHRIGNFRAVEGTATDASLALTPKHDAELGINALNLNPGQGFEYVLAEAMPGVVGFSCRVRFSFPIPDNPVGHVFPVMRLGNAVSLTVQPEFHPLPDQHAYLATLKIEFNSSAIGVFTPAVEMGVVEIPTRTFTDLRFDWHSSGQARAYADGRLVGYNNAVAPGIAFEMDRVVFGLTDFSPQVNYPRYRIAGAFVRVLRRADALGLFSRMLPAVKLSGEDEDRCVLRTASRMMGLLDRLRAFMATFHQKHSQPWSERDGPAAGPFTPEAIRAHELALASGIAMKEMLSTGDFSAPDSFLEPFTDFLRILREAQPAHFAALADELRAAEAEIVPEECRELFAKTLEDNRRALEPVLTLLAAAGERVREVAGGN